MEPSIESRKDKKLNISQKKFYSEIAAIIIGVIIAFIPPPAGLTTLAMWTLGLLMWAIINWIFNPMPNFVVMLLMCCAWFLLGIVPFETAFGAFAGKTIWLLIGVFGIGAAVTKSGLLGRIALLAMRVFPPNFKGQVMALMASGTLIAPLIPSTMAKVTIAGPMAAGIGQKLGFKPGSKGMGGLFSAMYSGFSLTGPIFISASFFGYMIHALLPTDVQAQFTWTYWFMVMIPWAIVFLIGCFFSIIKLYKPDEETPLPKDSVKKQLEELGPMSRDEKVTLTILALCVIFWVLESITKIPAAIPAIVGCALLIAFKVISPQDYNTKINWGLITFAGGVMGLATVLSTVGIPAWIGETFGPYMERVTGNPYLFVFTAAIAMFVIRLIIVDHMTAFTLFIVILTPFCLNAGISPWIAGITAYVSVMPWVVYYQNIQFIAAFESAGGEELIGYKQTIKYCFAYTVVTIIGLLVSVPYWQLLGLIN